MTRLLLLCLLTSCGFIQKKGSWGSRAFSAPKLQTIKAAAVNAVSSPHFWAPLSAGTVVYVSGQDKKMTRWGAEKNPIFGNQKRADQKSDDFALVLKTEMYASIFITSSWNETPESYVENKSKGALATHMTYSSSRDLTNQSKKIRPTQRPNREDNLSFPSGHSSRASIKNNIIAKNLESSSLSEKTRGNIAPINHVLTASTMWARVEGNKHHVSDVLAGYSVGFFLSSFLYDSLMNTEQNETVAIYPSSRRLTAAYTLYF